MSSGYPPIAVHSGCVTSSGPPPRARPFQTGSSGGHIPPDLQRHHVDHLHFRDAKGGGQPGATEFLRFPGLGDSTASYVAPLHLPQIPLCRYTRRNMEDELQSQVGIKKGGRQMFVLLLEILTYFQRMLR